MEPPEDGPLARHVVAVGSGKGGVGKSTLALNLALSLREDGARVGVLDADVYGPNIPLMVNLARRRPARYWDLAFHDPERGERTIEPVERHGLFIMSTGFIVAEDQPLTWDAGLVGALIYQLLHKVRWGDLDYLVVDLPPGTADLQQMFARQIPLSGVVIIVTPQDVAHLDARKAVEMYRQAGVEVLGGIENMSGLVCPHCDRRVEVFQRVREDRSIWAMGVEKLGEVPLDPAMSAAGETHPLLVARPDSPQAQAVRETAKRLAERLAALRAKGG